MGKTAIASPRRVRPTARTVSSGYLSFIKRRDALRTGFSTPPTPEPHISTAVLEAWADEVIDEDQVREQIAKCHPDGVRCERCEESVEFYRRREKAI